MLKEIRIGLLGCGVVGTGVIEVIEAKKEYIGQRLGVQFQIQRIAVRDVLRERHPIVDKQKLCLHWSDVCAAEDVDIVIEVIGGATVAKDAVLTALRHGKSVITANKELMARFGDEIRQTAAQHGAFVRHEASVLGGIPVLSTLETYFAMNQIRGLRGIFNGTSNFILTSMHQDGLSFEEALNHAQVLGYAEADPSMDVDGIDAWYKLQIILDSLAVPQAKRVGPSATGIRGISPLDVYQATQENAKVKHVVTAKWDAERDVVHCDVRPQRLDASDPLFHVDGVLNAICLEGDIVGDITLTGPGAGAYPTASAVLEDLVKVVQSQAARSR